MQWYSLHLKPAQPGNDDTYRVDIPLVADGRVSMTAFRPGVQRPRIVQYDCDNEPVFEGQIVLDGNRYEIVWDEEDKRLHAPNRMTVGCFRKGQHVMMHIPARSMVLYEVVDIKACPSTTKADDAENHPASAMELGEFIS